MKIPPKPSVSILHQIVEEKQREVARLPQSPVTSAALHAALRQRGQGRDFLAALRGAPGPVALIAEVKKASPSAGIICPDFDPVRIARDYDASGAACLSVLTDERFFQGSLEYLHRIREAVRLPLLRKDFIINERQVLESIRWGADAILLIVAILNDADLRRLLALAAQAGLAVLVETHDEDELERALAAGAELIGVNNRNLKTFEVNLATTERLAARCASLAASQSRPGPLLVAESGIHSRADVERMARCGARAILVGESLMRHADLQGKVREFDRNRALSLMRSAEGRLVLVAMFAATLALAGGSGLNVIVVVNQNSPNSLRLGNDYCEQRGVPGQNVFRLTGWTGGAISWDRAEFESLLLNPLLDMVATRNLADQAAFVLLSMDIPFQVINGASVNSTTSALFYGFKTNSLPPDPSLPATCSLPDYSSNSFAFSELPFQTAPPDTAPTNSFLAMMLTDATLAGAELQLVGGVASDSSSPTQTVYLARTSDSARNVRYVEFDNAVFDSRVRGDYSVQRVGTDSTSFTNSFGLLTGLADFSLPANAFVPGAIADSLTSFGGLILGPNDQTPLLAFLEAGAAGSYGTVVEPCNYVVKFPSPMDYVYQNRGFCLAEAYYQSILNPYQGLLAGEPLSAPFARRGRADWSSLNQGALVGGQVPIHINFYAAPNLPLDQVNLFVDGSFFQTLTNLPPTAGNVLSVRLGGFGLDYVVPAQASLGSVAAGLASVLNGGTNSTQVMAYAIGDRLELDSLNPSTPGAEMSLGASVSSPPGVSQTTFVTPALPAFLDTVATGYLGMAVSNSPLVGDWVQLSFLKPKARN